MTIEKLKELNKLQNKINKIDSVIDRINGRSSKATIADICELKDEIVPFLEDLKSKLCVEFVKA